jgi:hypothetical protein
VAEIVQFVPKSRPKIVRPVFPSISGSLTIKSMDDLPLSGGAADLIMGSADTVQSGWCAPDADPA